MKVDATPEIAGTDYTVRKNNGPEPGGTEFSDILKANLDSASGIGETSSQSYPVQGISRSQFDLCGGLEANPLDQLENYLNMLAEYQEKLGNPDVSLKELAPLVEEVTQENERLSATLDTISEDDSLKEILNETMVLGSLETIKFNRGDYNPQ